MFYLLFLIGTIFNIPLVASKNVLLGVQIVWRHGDRPPTKLFDYDPNKNAWNVPLGQLTQRGMRQHFDLGKRFYQKYTQENKLLSPNYDANQIYVRSTDVDRTLASAYSNLAGFYSESKNTYPNDGKGWPKGWTPVPVHTVKNHKDFLLNPDYECPRMDQLRGIRRNCPKLLEYESTLSDLCNYLTKYSGDEVTGHSQITRLYSIIRLETRYYNLPQPSWVTPDIYHQMEVVVNKTMNFMEGDEGFGLPKDVELISLKGGNLAYTMLKNIEDMMANRSSVKPYLTYSAHDNTLWAFANVLGAKIQIMGEGFVDYAANFSVELWEDDNNKYFVKLVYAGSAYGDFKTVTHYISGCPQSELCPVEVFGQYLQPYVLKNPLHHCAEI